MSLTKQKYLYSYLLFDQGANSQNPVKSFVLIFWKQYVSMKGNMFVTIF